MKRLTINVLEGLFWLLALLLMANSMSAQEAKDKPAPIERGRGYKPLTAEKRAEFYAASEANHGGRLARYAKFQDLPPSFDARSKGWVIPVGDQGQCVLPGSKIMMADGSLKLVQDVRNGDMVCDADGKPSRVNYCLSRRVDEEVVCVDAGGDSAWMTLEHPVFVSACGHVPAGYLTTKDFVVTRNKAGESLQKAVSLNRKKYAGKVYNLLVSSETYVVNGIVVHNCGSCYVYSTIYGTLTQAFVKAGYGKADGSFVMAVQYGMDCHDFGGCNGGNGTEVIDWIMKNGWYAEKWVDTDGKTHNDYPAYSARSSTCRKVPGAKLWKPASWGLVSASANRPATTLEIKTALYNFGALNVSLDAGGQFGNGTATITSLGTSIDHEIELVAWDDAKDGGAFLLKNQWSTDWGNAGYRWVTYKAAQNLVDIFFVAADAVPPPPTPIPPTPIPPTPGGMLYSMSVGKDGVITFTPQPTSATITVTRATTLGEILDAINKGSKIELPKEMGFNPFADVRTAKALPKGNELTIEERERNLSEGMARLEALLKKLEGKK